MLKMSVMFYDVSESVTYGFDFRGIGKRRIKMVISDASPQLALVSVNETGHRTEKSKKGGICDDE